MPRRNSCDPKRHRVCDVPLRVVRTDTAEHTRGFRAKVELGGLDISLCTRFQLISETEVAVIDDALTGVAPIRGAAEGSLSTPAYRRAGINHSSLVYSKTFGWATP